MTVDVSKFQVIPTKGFRLIVLTYTPIHTHCDKVIAKSTTPYCVVGADNKRKRRKQNKVLLSTINPKTVVKSIIIIIASCM